MIIEGIVTTLNEDRSTHVSPMGPVVDGDLAPHELEHFTLRPYQTSRTYRNLRRHGEGVFHITDDVDLLARAAIGRLDAIPQLLPAEAVAGSILESCCRWYAFRVTQLDDRQERTSIDCEVVDVGRRRDFLGFNRAKHAVVEAAILATRLHLLPHDQIREQLARLEVIVGKTGGAQELAAFACVDQYVTEQAISRNARSIQSAPAAAVQNEAG